MEKEEWVEGGVLPPRGPPFLRGLVIAYRSGDRTCLPQLALKSFTVAGQCRIFTGLRCFLYLTTIAVMW